MLFEIPLTCNKIIFCFLFLFFVCLKYKETVYYKILLKEIF